MFPSRACGTAERVLEAPQPGLTPKHEDVMYEATQAHSREPALAAITITWGSTQSSPTAPPNQDAIVRDACSVARDLHGAMSALSLSVADLLPDDPRHEAATDAIAILQPGWRKGVERVVSVPAAGSSGLRSKARLLHSLVGPDAPERAVGGPPMQQLAASLVADVLRWTPGF